MSEKNKREELDYQKELLKRLEPFNDILFRLSVVIGEKNIQLKNLLDFKRGKVIQFDNLVGEPVKVLINETHVANGEVVVIDEQMGIRILNILESKDNELIQEIKKIVLENK